MRKERQAKLPTRNINLTDRYDAFLTAQIDSGRFKNASEAVRAALHLLEQRDLEDEAKLEAFRREVKIGFDAAERGEVIRLSTDEDIAEFFQGLKAERNAAQADNA